MSNSKCENVCPFLTGDLSSLSKFEIHLLSPSLPQRKLTAHLKTKRLIWSTLLLKQMLKTKEKFNRNNCQKGKAAHCHLLTVFSNVFSLRFSFADKPNLPDMPRGRLNLLQRDPAGIIQPTASINFKTKQKNPFLLLVCCFKTNFCQNRHIASLVFLPHTGKCNSVSRAFPIHLSIWQIPAVCKIDSKPFWAQLFGKFFSPKQKPLFTTLWRRQNKFLASDSDFISIRLFKINQYPFRKFQNFASTQNSRFSSHLCATSRQRRAKMVGRAKWRDVSGDIFRKRSPTKCRLKRQRKEGKRISAWIQEETLKMP